MLKKKEKKKKKIVRYLEVNLWQKEFSENSEKAIFSIYAEKFNVSKKNISRYSFSHCLNSLRKLEDNSYVASIQQSHY